MLNMQYKLKEVGICADREFEMIRITDQVRAFVRESGVQSGIVFVITKHTTTGITVNESLPCVERDIMDTLDRLAPERAGAPEVSADRQPLRFPRAGRRDPAGHGGRHLFLRV